jgi:hypothetical protein
VEPSHELTIWMARACAAAYLAALILILYSNSGNARFFWTTALALYLVHVYCAFQYVYSWSHAVAYRETARQTADLFGLNWGGGLYLNYLFTVVWCADCLWWWLNPRTYSTRPRSISLSVHALLAFMFMNATIVVWILRSLR